MIREVTISVPKKLSKTGQASLAFTVRVATGDSPTFDHWSWECRGPFDDRPRATRGDLIPCNRPALVTVPKDHCGEVVLTVTLENRHTGTRMVGSASVRPAELLRDNVKIEASGDAVIWKPSAVTSHEFEPVGDETVSYPVCLTEEIATSVPLGDVLDHGRFLRLRDQDDGFVRVLSMHVGSELVIGRCFGHQLHPAPAKLLGTMEHDQVHWVTNWDDREVNQISALVRLVPSDEPEDVLELVNLTGYSRRPQQLQVDAAGDHLEVSAQESGTIPLPISDAISLRMGEGTNRAEIARFKYRAVEHGGMVIPIFITHRTGFHFPPEGGNDACKVHFLGVWIPLSYRDLNDTLALADAPISLDFHRDRVRLKLEFDEGTIFASSNEDLRAALSRA